MDPLRVAVIGGSLGGLTAACLLRDAGHEVNVYERSPIELEQRGAGIGFLKASYRYLVERAGIRLDGISIATDQLSAAHLQYVVVFRCIKPDIHEMWPPGLNSALKRRK